LACLNQCQQPAPVLPVTSLPQISPSRHELGPLVRHTQGWLLWYEVALTTLLSAGFSSPHSTGPEPYVLPLDRCSDLSLSYVEKHVSQLTKAVLVLADQKSVL
jgi:hypothetical protein